MPLPVAHGIVGASIVVASYPTNSFSQDKGKLLLGAALAICPDFDVFFLWVVHMGNNWHRGFSHSITFAIVAGVLASLFAGGLRLKSIAVYTAATFSHPVLDLLTSKARDGVELALALLLLQVQAGGIPLPEV